MGGEAGAPWHHFEYTPSSSSQLVAVQRPRAKGFVVPASQEWAREVLSPPTASH